MSVRRHRLPALLAPRSGELGLLSADDAALRRRSVRAWRLFAELAQTAELSAPTRSHGHDARDLLVGVGSWPDSRGLAEMIADARAGVTDAEPQSHADARLRAAHRSAPEPVVRDSVSRAVDHIEAWWADPHAATLARLVTASPLGPVPIGTYLYASSFHLAVTARDLIPAGAAPCPELDDLAVVALVDSAGAVAARLGASASIAAVTPDATAATGALGGSWRTVTMVDDGHGEIGPAVVGPAELVVDVAAGRVDFRRVARSLRLRHPRRLVDMSVVLDGIPELPAATMLRRAAAFARALPW